ncbi:MAG: ABC-F family ATP-binding cassette domain-containing protein [Candidatus Altimarinota bacterium]
MSILLQINNLEMAYGTQVILDGANLTISENQKVAVVGRNGAGKSTLFRLIVGEEDPTGGEILVLPGTRIGYLTQHSPFLPDETIMEFLQRESGEESWVCAKIAAQFQIKTDLFDRKVTSLAGGYQMRVKLIAMLAKEPNLLLLDEPTNYLDLSTLLLLENFLRKYKGAFLLISHDREFIKKTCNQTLEIDQGKTYLFPQSLEEYLAYKAEKIVSTEKYNKKVNQQKEHLQSFVDRFGAKASKAAQAKSKMKQIEKLKTIEIVSALSTSKIRIPKVEDKKGMALGVEDLSIGYVEKVVASKINFDITRGERIAVVGDNGQGKTTFLKTIAGELEALKGKFNWGANIRFSYYAQHTPATLNSSSLVKEYLLASAPKDINHKDIYEMAGNFLFKDSALDKEISVLSGGEKARLCLASILLQKNHVLLLDEPTNHLDFETVEALAQALSESNITVIFVSHNRTFVETLANGIVEVKNGQAARYHHNYEDYVYHIQTAIEQDLAEQSGKKSSPSSTTTTLDQTPNDPEETRLKLKKLKNKIYKIDTTIKKLAEEKDTLLAWFEAHPTQYSEEKSLRMGEIINQMEAAEGEWLEAQLQMEGLK